MRISQRIDRLEGPRSLPVRRGQCCLACQDRFGLTVFVSPDGCEDAHLPARPRPCLHFGRIPECVVVLEEIVVPLPQGDSNHADRNASLECHPALRQ